MVALAVAAVLMTAGPVWAGDPAAPETTEPRIVGGTAATPGEYPFMSALVWSDVGNARAGLRCGASMLDSEWFLTAAHCTENHDPEEFDVVVGRHTLTDPSGERIAVAEIHEHPDWDTDTYENDIALLRVAVPATAGAPVYWATDTLADWFAAGTVGTVIGWGLTENNPPGTGFGAQDVMREVEVPIRTASECTASVPPGEFFAAAMICAGETAGGVDSCQGDSGGPMVVPEGDRWRQVGIVSWGYGCADPGDYGFYTRLATYDQWIVDTTGFTTCEGAPATMVGTAAGERIVGTGADDVIVGGGGGDVILGKSGNDILCSATGGDRLFGGPGNDLVFGSTGDDRLYGSGGVDILFGDGGSDRLYGGSNEDTLYGGTNDDKLYGGSGDDLIYGEGGDDKLLGQYGDDELQGGAGTDSGYGGKGTDVCVVEAGFTGCETTL